MGMKKHGSKKDVPVDNGKKEPQRLTWKSKYELICASHDVSNGTEETDVRDEDETKTNALDGLSGYLSSEDSSSGESELHEEVQNFLKEVDEIYKEDQKRQQNSLNVQVQNTSVPVAAPVVATGMEMAVQYEQTTAPTVAWQECYDSNTGYTYYWNLETNEVRWEMPAEYQSYMEALKQWQQYQAQGVAALLQARVQQQLQQQQQQQQLQHPLLQHAQAQQKTGKPESKASAAKSKGKKRPSVKHSDSEDEKIELITSYGGFSEDESSDTEKSKIKTPKVKKKKLEPKSASPKPSMGPQLPPGGNRILRRFEKPKPLTNSLVPYHPDLEDSDADDSLENSKLNFVPDNGPPGAEPEKLKVAAETSPKEEEKPPAPDPEEGKVDSKEEEDDELTIIDKLKTQTQVLVKLGGDIPEGVKSIIAENSEKESKTDEKEIKNLKLKLSARAKKLISASTTTAKARATDFIQTPDGLKPIQKNKGDEESSSLSKSEDSDKKKGLWQGMSPSLLSGDNKKHNDLKIREEGNRGGFGFVASQDGKKRQKTEKIAFVKADIFVLSEDDKGGSVEGADDESSDEPMDISDVSGLLSDKMKFLSEGKEPVPPVQTWMIQLETLLAAWDSKNLKRNFLEDWLTRTSKELESLECSVAPDGWVCEWQRCEKRYQYRKLSSGETTWEFPVNATGGGEEEMDLSTTPPPLPATPPAPTISVPSPPSPPHISDTPPPVPIPDEVPPLPGDIPPLPPLPPPTPPPPPPQSPPPQSPLHPSQPLPPGVDPPDLPPLPPSASAHSPPPAPVPVPVLTPAPAPAPVSEYTPPLPAAPPAPIYQPSTHLPTPFYQPFPHPQQLPGMQPPLPVSEPVVAPTGGPHDLSSELDNFYSDLATLEPEEVPPPPPSDPPLPPPPETLPPEAPIDKGKKKKKTKLAPGLSLKKKGVSSLVAKWQQVQEDVRRDMKHD